ncbi:ATP synthase subunit I [Sagittula salina]|uniref:N-ATPase, AtpR subunit n=1 Tax=Sagittula salina TaxID=2820268 RepID=A0A940MSA7_9RHOB|nr:ATP synthase subunit I [Sagittula salina]MBP0485068.1 hypothetical protein [Sagittula salina]
MTTLLCLAAGLVGLATGWLHFATLARVTDLLLEGRLAGVALQLGRFGLTGGFLALCAGAGWPVLLSGAAGIMAGRALVLWRAQWTTR